MPNLFGRYEWGLDLSSIGGDRVPFWLLIKLPSKRLNFWIAPYSVTWGG